MAGSTLLAPTGVVADDDGDDYKPRIAGSQTDGERVHERRT